jgi:glycosyltransferase involved in cell wall biosynthesis
LDILANKKLNHKILYISYDGMTDHLGQSQVLPYLCGLSKKGFQFDLISFEKPEKFIVLKDVISKICFDNNINWHPLTYTKKPPVISTLYDILRMKRLAKQLHQSNNYSIVHCRSYIPGMIGRNLKKHTGLPFIFDMRGFWVDERVEGKIWNLKNPLFKFIYTFFKKIETGLFKDADQIVSLTNAAIPTINKIRSSENKNITVIPCCVDENHFNFKNISITESQKVKTALGFSNSDFILTYLGSLSTWYMPEKMLDFYNILLQKIPDAKFLFITQENPQPIINLAIQKRIPTSNLVFKSAHRSNLPAILSISDSTIYFITPSFSKIASSPTKKAELLCMGIPSVCNDGVGDTTQIMETNYAGFVCRNFNESEYLKAIDFLTSSLKKPDEKERLRSIGINYFSLEKGVEKYNRVYEQALTARK